MSVIGADFVLIGDRVISISDTWDAGEENKK